MFPELIEGTLMQIKADSAILDAEALAYNATSEEFLPFQETTRRRRKHGVDALAQQLPLKAFVFDILYRDGVSLLDTPLVERLKILGETMHEASDTLMVTASHQVEDAHKLTLLFDEAISSEPGYALRFPRLVSFRERDKQPEDATTVQELIELYENQSKK